MLQQQSLQQQLLQQSELQPKLTNLTDVKINPQYITVNLQ